MGTKSQPRGIEPAWLLGRLKDIITEVHPDRFGGDNVAATEATKLLVQLRDEVKTGRLKSRTRSRP